MAKTKRYNGDENDGSFVESGSGPQMGEDTGMSEKEPESPKPSTFKEAFASARKAGDKTFMFGGKKFTTELASAKKPASTSVGSRVPVPEPAKPKAEKKYEGPKYQSLQDRARGYAAAREKSGVSMYGARKAAPREPLPTASDQAYKRGGTTASKRADGIAQRGKTRGKMR